MNDFVPHVTAVNNINLLYIRMKHIKATWCHVLGHMMANQCNTGTVALACRFVSLLMQQ